MTAIPQAMFADVAVMHLDLKKGYVKQEISSIVSYITEVRMFFYPYDVSTSYTH